MPGRLFPEDMLARGGMTVSGMLYARYLHGAPEFRCFFLFVYWFAGRPLLHVMTGDAVVIELAMDYMPWLMLMPFLGCAAFIWDGVFVGATDTRPVRDSMILAAVGFFVIYYAGIAAFGIPAGGLLEDAVTVAADGSVSARREAWLGIHILCGAYFVHLMARSLYMTLLYKSLVRKKFS